DHPTNIQIDLGSGVLVVVTPRHAQKLEMLEYFLVPGTSALPLAELSKQARAGKILDTLFGGRDVDTPMQFHDVAPGKYMLCIDPGMDRDHHQPLVCKPLVVPVDKLLLELDVDL